MVYVQGRQCAYLATAASAALSVRIATLVAWAWRFLGDRRKRDRMCVSSPGAVFIHMKEHPPYTESRLVQMSSLWSAIIASPVFRNRHLWQSMPISMSIFLAASPHHLLIKTLRWEAVILFYPTTSHWSSLSCQLSRVLPTYILKSLAHSRFIQGSCFFNRQAAPRLTTFYCKQYLRLVFY